MPLSKTLQRELEVAFSKTAQATWVRVLKYVILGYLMYCFWSSTLFWIILGIVLLLSLSVHFWYRYKTAAWTKSYGGWDYEQNKPKL